MFISKFVYFLNLIKFQILLLFGSFVLSSFILTSLEIPVEVNARGGCFLTGTLVKTKNGQIPIEKLQKGDEVISLDKNGNQEISKIGEIKSFEVEEYFVINEKIKVTATHPFFVGNGLENNPNFVEFDNINSENINSKISSTNSQKMIPTQTNPVQTNLNLESFKILQVRDLKIGDFLVSQSQKQSQVQNQIQTTQNIQNLPLKLSAKIQTENSNQKNQNNFLELEKITKIEKIKSKETVFNLINVIPNHNYLANNFLVHNKGGGGGGGGGGSRGGSRSTTPKCSTIIDPIEKQKCWDNQNQQNIIMFGIVGIILAGSSVINMKVKMKENQEKQLISQSYYGKTFTNNSRILDFVRAIFPKFQNIYHNNYLVDDQNWECLPMTISLKLESQNSQNTEKFLQSIEQIFLDYQSDWTNKNWENMKNYTTESYFKKQKDIFEKSFGQNWDIVFEPNINLVGINSVFKNWANQELIRVQINCQMINFGIKENQVYLGNDKLQTCTEFWTFILENGEYKLFNIEN